MSGRTRQVTVNPRKVHFPQKSIHKTSKDSENQVDHFWPTLAGKSRKSDAVLSLREPAGYCPRSAGTDEDRASRLRPTWSGHLTCLPCGCSSSSRHYRYIVIITLLLSSSSSLSPSYHYYLLSSPAELTPSDLATSLNTAFSVSQIEIHTKTNVHILVHPNSETQIQF